MKSAHLYTTGNDIEVRLKDVPVPKPLPSQVLIRVVAVGTNPKDWKYLLQFNGKQGETAGDDIAGFVEAVGSDVTEFKVGDRVGAFHEMTTPHGGFAEFAIAWENSTFHLRKETSFEEAATIPLAAMTAALALFCYLRLPEPWVLPTRTEREELAGGVLVYGAASAVGAFAIKLLARANIHPIIAVAGRGIPYVESLVDISKGDVIIDYRGGDDEVVKGLRIAVPPGNKLLYALDAVSEGSSYLNIVKALDPYGHITFVLPGDYKEVPSTVHKTITLVGAVHGNAIADSQHGHPDMLSDFGYAWFRLFSVGLKDGWFTGHPYEVVPGGLHGVETGLRNLREGKASAVKYLCRIAETEGLS
ncbi:hypothetical protein H2200_000899 [Cladophialophora chaetospira]|uniref:Enoyl reductase (ER) domain-containing protein n=1 Tax=Cladophialophora chaetospira TaxID=386627 RepID=A0AA38XPC6_9EURO|nr:hypothetical protein H2200_000899 [Cladophialophora chaetospira]